MAERFREANSPTRIAVSRGTDSSAGSLRVFGTACSLAASSLGDGAGYRGARPQGGIG